MTHAPAEARIITTAASLAEAVEGLLSRILLQEEPNVGDMERFIVGYGVEADDIVSLIARAIEEIEALASEHNATTIACEVSGMRSAREGSRLWGTIECVPSPGATHQTTRVDNIGYEQLAADQWHVSARITNRKINKEPS